MRSSELVQEIARSAPRLVGAVRRTPTARSDWLSDQLGSDVYLKLENYQVTGSFKIRGATNALLTRSSSTAGVITASTGNHGAAVALAARHVGRECTVLAPAGVSDSKLQRMQRLGAAVEIIKGDPAELEMRARRRAETENLIFVSPYNDPAVIAGQGTVGLELAEDSPIPLCKVYVAVGGGGLIAGVAAALKHTWDDVEIVGCYPAKSPVMAESVKAGAIVDVPVEDTLSDGTAGGVEKDSITLDLCSELVDTWISVDENQISTTIAGLVSQEHMLVEGAAAVAAAAAVSYETQRGDGAPIGVIICGANISPATLRSVLR